ncbi:MAG: [acyl-carrier-protein] S-malonyltransferase [Candidatus Omnitrophota bacterium]|jgi:[acyl-carrier-protein] S-malonyltransferase|nr:MAG: [acyl-carrier-protein] S-malonyltransferase [Candidatus Omnitrophota bacterium]
MVGYLFAGQGSQYVGMGKDLYESFPESKAVFDTADKVLGFALSKLCFEGPAEELKQTKNCQPAILTMTTAAWEAFCSVHSPQPTIHSYAAGLSLGEYSALVAAEAISFEDAVYLVRHRGEFMEEEALRVPGKMLSVLGLDLSAITQICRDSHTHIANINSPSQIVISGGAGEIEQAKVIAQERGAKRSILLEVSGAFHSPFMKEASAKLAKELDKVKIQSPRMPVVSNVTAKPVLCASEIKENLIAQVVSSVLWEDSMRYILAQGVSSFFEFGPGKVLKGLMGRIDANAQVKNIEKKDEVLSVRGECHAA